MSSRILGPEYGLTAGNLMAALPEALRQDSSVLALAESVAGLLASRPEEIDRLRIYPAIDALPEDLLDILAYDFKVDWWDPEYSLDEKRWTLKTSWKVHKTLGTKAALEAAMSAVYPGTEVEEWFEYGGEPHHFRVFIRGEETAIGPGRLDEFKKAIVRVKRLSSWLDSIITSTAMEPAVVYMAADFHETYSKTVLPDLEPDFPGSSFVLAPFMGQGRTITCVPVVPDPDVPELQAVPQFAGHAGSCMRTVLPVLEDHNSQLSGTSDAQVNDHTNNRTRPASNLKEETT